MKITNHISLAIIILSHGAVPNLWAQSASPTAPKLVTATLRPAEPSKTPPGRVVNRRPPPKGLLEQKWPASTENLAIPAAIKMPEADLREKFERAQSLMAERKPELALPILLDAVKAAPNNFEIQFTLGFCLAMLHRPGEAVSHFQKAVKLSPRNADARLGLCKVFAETSKTIEAIDECREAVRLAPTRVSFKRELANLYLHTDQVFDAIPLFASSPDDLMSMGLLGDSYFVSGEYYLAAGVYEKIVARWSDISLTYLRLSQVYDYLDRPNDSITAARRFVELDPKLIFAHLNLGERLKTAGFFEQSIDAAKHALSLDPKSGNAALLLSQNYSILGETENTLASLRIAYKYLPRTVPLAYHLGSELLFSGSAAEAVEPLEFANTNAPDTPDFMRNLAWSYIQVHRYDEGVELFEKATRLSPLPPNMTVDFSTIKNRHELIARLDEYKALAEGNPKDVNVRLRLAEIYQFKDMLAEAERQFLDIVKIIPNDYQSHNKLAIFYSEYGQQEKAIEPMRKAVQLKPHHVLYGSLAAQLRKMGRLDEAIEAGKKAVEMKGDSLEARLFLGESLLQKGRRDEGLREYLVAVQIAPGDVRPNFRLAWLYIKMGNKEGAFRQYGILKNLVPTEVKWLELCLRANFGTVP